MKNLKVLLLAVICLSLNNLEAQNVWKGGAPGQETKWDVAKNWSESRVPDWADNVIIPDISSCSGYYPVINCEVEPIAHLEIQSNANLTILSTGKLVIDGVTTFNTGITLVGDIIVIGDLEIVNTALSAIDNLSGRQVLDQKLMSYLKRD